MLQGSTRGHNEQCTTFYLSGLRSSRVISPIHFVLPHWTQTGLSSQPIAPGLGLLVLQSIAPVGFSQQRGSSISHSTRATEIGATSRDITQACQQEKWEPLLSLSAIRTGPGYHICQKDWHGQKLHTQGNLYPFQNHASMPMDLQ